MTDRSLAKLAKLHAELARDIARQARNHILFDRMRTPARRERLMIYLIDNQGRLIRFAAILLVFVFWLAVINRAFADGVQCPDTQPCRVLYLSQQEEKVLLAPNGVLDTAAQGRAIELGPFVVYFKGRIAQSPQGEVKPAPDKPSGEVPQNGVDTEKK